VVPADANPFRVTRIESLPYRAPGFSWDAFLGHLETHAYRGAIVGPHGSGKTTLLLETQRCLRDRGISVTYGFLNEQTRRKGRAACTALSAVPDDTIFFLDGAEQLDPLAWRWLLWKARRLRGLVITAHQPGRLPTLYQTHASETMLRELLNALVPDEVDDYWPRARDQFHQRGGNVREVFFALYDDCARDRAPAQVPGRRP
jgi:hypothetical protein